MAAKYSAKLDKVLAEINTKFGTNTIIDLEDEKRNVEILCSTGSIGLDLAIGGGFPKGRVIEIYGPESSGKTTLAIHAIADVQKKGGIAAFIDVENAFDAFYARNLGVDIKRLIFSQPDNGEQALDTIYALCCSGEVDLIVCDSVAAIMPKAEIEGDAGDSKMGLRARLINQSVVKIVPQANKNGCTVIFLNQLRDTIGNFYGPFETTTGGKGLKFFASIRLDIRRLARNEGELESGEKGYVSTTVRVKSVKNKCFPPFREAEFDILFGKGISQESEYISAALKLNILKKTNSGICFTEETPLFPSETPIASSQPKLVTAFDEIDSENHPLYWVQREIVLRVQVAMEKIKEEELDAELAPIYEKKEKDNEYAKQYLELASKASSSSKILEAKYYIDLAFEKSPFDKDIVTKYKAITKRYSEKISSIKDFVIEVVDVEKDGKLIKIDTSTGEEIFEEGNKTEEIIDKSE